MKPEVKEETSKYVVSLFKVCVSYTQHLCLTLCREENKKMQ